MVLSIMLCAATPNSVLESVRVFMMGAEINRTATATVPSGIGEVVFTGLPVDIDPNSIQISSKGQFTILSVSHRHNYLESPQVSDELKMLQDSLRYYQAQINQKQSLLKVYQEEESLLLSNKSIGGSESGVRVQELQNMADFFRRRMIQVKELQLQTSENIRQVTRRHERINNQIRQLSPRQSQQVSEIVVTTSATRQQNGEFSFSYLTWNASWQAMYDLRAHDTESPVEAVLKASVTQNTGEDWENIQLTLSTGDPLHSRHMPRLTTWFLRFLRPVAEPPVARQAYGEMARREMQLMAAPEVEEAMDIATTAADFTQRAQTQTTTEYRITTPYNFPSGSRARMVEVLKAEVPALYVYYAVPRLDREAHLVARLTQWEEFFNLPGEASLFFENAYVGKTRIDPANTADTLTVSLGTDRSIVLERNRQEDYSRKGILGRRTTETVAWELVVRNNKNQAVTLELLDQIPVSTDADIQISLEEKSGAHHNEANGFLKWRIEVPASGTERKNFRYTVRYPSDKNLRIE